MCVVAQRQLALATSAKEEGKIRKHMADKLKQAQLLLPKLEIHLCMKMDKGFVL